LESGIGDLTFATPTESLDFITRRGFLSSSLGDSAQVTFSRPVNDSETRASGGAGAQIPPIFVRPTDKDDKATAKGLNTHTSVAPGHAEDPVSQRVQAKFVKAMPGSTTMPLSKTLDNELVVSKSGSSASEGTRKAPVEHAVSVGADPDFETENKTSVHQW
jgi:hypothetical protein